MASLTFSFSDLKGAAEQEGLTLTAALPRVDAQRALQNAAPHLAAWQDASYAGEMRFMQRPARMLTDISTILPEAQSALLFLVPYAEISGEPPQVAAGCGRIARYAWGRDYHRALKKRLLRFVGRFEALHPSLRARVFTDAVPILERTLAEAAGLGFIGKSSLVIRPGVGTFFFICEIFWNAAITGVDERPLPEPPGSGCGTCARCLERCPTGALVRPGVLDSRRCISYLTIEKKTPFALWEAEAIGDWIFGCDVCQEVCPFNHRGIATTPLAEFDPERGSGGSLALEELLNIRAVESFAESFGGTALMRAGREALLRNACAVLANTGQVSSLSKLEDTAANDPAALVRDEARRSIERLKGMS